MSIRSFGFMLRLYQLMRPTRRVHVCTWGLACTQCRFNVARLPRCPRADNHLHSQIVKDNLALIFCLHLEQTGGRFSAQNSQNGANYKSVRSEKVIMSAIRPDPRGGMKRPAGRRRRRPSRSQRNSLLSLMPPSPSFAGPASSNP